MKKYAIFDLDGTVIDSMWAWENVGFDFLAAHSIKPTEDLQEEFRTRGLKGSAQFLIDNFNIDMSVEKIVEDFCTSVDYMYRNTIGLKEDILDFIVHLKNNGVKMCIATACNYNLAEAILKRLDILHNFEFILTCDELNTNKTLPLIYTTAATRLGGTTKNTVVFEDTLHTIITAKNAGFEVIAIHDEGEKRNHHLISQTADKFIKSYSELFI